MLDLKVGGSTNWPPFGPTKQELLSEGAPSCPPQSPQDVESSGLESPSASRESILLC